VRRIGAFGLWSAVWKPTFYHRGWAFASWLEGPLQAMAGFPGVAAAVPQLFRLLLHNAIGGALEKVLDCWYQLS